MKSLSLKLLLTTIFACAVSVSMAQKSAKEAIKYAESIDFSDAEVDIADTVPVRLSYIIPDKGIKVKSGLYIPKDVTVIKQDTVTTYRLPEGGVNTEITEFDNGDKPFAINAGWWMLHVLYTDKKLSRAGKVKVADLRGRNYEEGKYCFITYDPETDAVFIKLTTDSAHINSVKNVGKINIDAQTKKREYLAFQATNPNLLDGVWSGEKKRLMNTFSMQYSIDGNRMKFEGKSKSTGKTFVAEGTIRYNENTLIFTPQKAAIDGKEVEKFSDENPYIWYYTVTGDKLHLEGGRLFGKTLIWENTGEFHKTN